MISRRTFLTASSSLLAAGSSPRIAVGESRRQVGPGPTVKTVRLRPGGDDFGYDPWIEIDGDAIRHNLGEVVRLARGQQILAVVKNNAYGLGDTVVGPLLASSPEVAALACTRPAEAIAMREAGVRKPIVIMSEVSESEAVELAARDVTLSCWLDDSAARLRRVVQQARKPVSVHLYLDTGLNREGMPYRRALPWIEMIAREPGVRIDGTYHMFVHEVEFDRVQHARFLEVTRAARDKGVKLGLLHGAPTFELFYLPEARLDMVRVANALCGNYPGADVRDRAALKPVFRLKARLTRVERLEPGDAAGFERAFVAESPTWVGLLPIGHTDGFPIAAAGRCSVVIGGRLYPILKGGVSSAHTLVNLGPEQQERVGDTATLVGGDDPAIDPAAVAAVVGLPLQQMITKFNALLPRRLA